MIKLKRDNVVKTVDSEAKAQRLEREGFRRLSHPEEVPAWQDGAEDKGEQPGEPAKMGGTGGRSSARSGKSQ